MEEEMTMREQKIWKTEKKKIERKVSRKSETEREAGKEIDGLFRQRLQTEV